MENKLPEIKNRSFYLYGIYCPYNDDLKYIGITTGTLCNRLKSHLRKPTNGKIALWFKELKKDGKLPEIKLIMSFNNYTDLLKGEINEIKKHKDSGVVLYNIADGGYINPMYGKKHTIDARLKISQHHKGLKRTEKQKEERKILLKKLWSDDIWSSLVRTKMLGNKNSLGHKHSDESKLLMSKTHIERGYNKGKAFFSGFRHSNETKNKMSVINSGENNPMFGKKLSDESIKKRSQTIITNGTFKGEKNPNFKYKIDKNLLVKLYIDENKTIYEISTVFNCSKGVIKNNLKKYGIRKPNRNKYNLNINDILYHKINGLNLKQIGEMYGCSNKIISKFIKKNGK